MANSNLMWSAFYAGLAAPISLFSATPSYEAYTLVLQPAQAFAIVGGYLTQTLPSEPDDRRNGDAKAA